MPAGLSNLLSGLSAGSGGSGGPKKSVLKKMPVTEARKVLMV